jgi:RNA polymerase sigma-70 factor (ECF subfamily)
MSLMAATIEIEKHLVSEHEAFLAFVRKRIADPELAADIVQESFLKALKGAGQLREGENMVAWFYRILRRTIIDAYRRRDARGRALEQFEAEANQPMSAADERTLCGCLRKLLPTLKPEYAEAVEQVELQQKPVESVAKELGISPGNLRVRLHRGRKQLQERLEQTCRLCAKHGCLDCECEESP